MGQLMRRVRLPLVRSLIFQIRASGLERGCTSRLYLGIWRNMGLGFGESQCLLDSIAPIFFFRKFGPTYPKKGGRNTPIKTRTLRADSAFEL